MIIYDYLCAMDIDELGFEIKIKPKKRKCKYMCLCFDCKEYRIIKSLLEEKQDA